MRDTTRHVQLVQCYRPSPVPQHTTQSTSRLRGKSNTCTAASRPKIGHDIEQECPKIGKCALVRLGLPRWWRMSAYPKTGSIKQIELYKISTQQERCAPWRIAPAFEIMPNGKRAYEHLAAYVARGSTSAAHARVGSPCRETRQKSCVRPARL